MACEELESPLPTRKQKLREHVAEMFPTICKRPAMKPPAKPMKSAAKPVMKALAKKPAMKGGAAYTLMYYKAGPAYAVRVRGGRQLFQLLCKKIGKAAALWSC